MFKDRKWRECDPPPCIRIRITIAGADLGACVQSQIALVLQFKRHWLAFLRRSAKA